MKKYLAIGHFKDSKNIESISSKQNTKKDFQSDLKGNAFVAYAIITESKMIKLEEAKNARGMELFEEVKKMTSNYRVWGDLEDYIEQCLDIMKEKMEMAE